MASSALCGRVPLKVSIYNPLSLAPPFRLQHIANTLNSDILFVPGTTLRLPKGANHTIVRLGSYWALSFGWQRSPYTNKAAGCAIVFRSSKFAWKDTVTIRTPSAEVLGRAGAVRIKNKVYDVNAIVQYSPPISGRDRCTNVKSAQVVTKWMQETIVETPVRCLPLLGADLNTRVGMQADGTQWQKGVGEWHLGKANEGASSWMRWLEHHDYTFASTTWAARRVAGTYFHHTGSTSLTDYLLMPSPFLAKIKCYIPWRQARVLQLIPSARPRDHVPVTFLLDLPWGGVWNRTPTDAVRWDYDRMAEALQFSSSDRMLFLKRLEAEFTAETARLRQADVGPFCDVHWQIWIDVLQKVATMFFAARPFKQPKWVIALQDKRLELLKELSASRDAIGRIESESEVSRILLAKREISTVQKQLRAHKRKELDTRQRKLEARLEAAAAKGRRADEQKICRDLASTSLGPKKRRTNVLPCHRPSAAEIRSTAALPATLGGLSAVEVQWGEEAAKWTTPEYDEEGNVCAAFLPRERDCNIKDAAAADLKAVIWSLKKSIKRKSAPPWSVPAEVLLIALCPGYCSVREKKTTAIGGPGLAEVAETSMTCKVELLKILEHLHAGQFIPLVANKSMAFLQDKNNGKPGLLGQRILHLYCTFWRHWHGAAMHQSVKATQPRWQSYSHAYLKGRRREGAMITQNSVQMRLMKANVHSLGHLRDMTNAFVCTANDDRTEAVKDLTPPYCPDDGKLTHRTFFEQKLVASTVVFNAYDEDGIHVVPQTGNIVGSSEGPRLFSWAYNKKIDKWLHARKECAPSPTITLVHPKGSRHTGEAVIFADDSNTRRIIPPGESLQDAIWGLYNDDKCFDDIMNEGNWVQNTTKADIVPSMGNAGLRKFKAVAALDPDTKYISDRCVPHARHLGGTVAYNSSCKKEIDNRVQSMKAGWAALGRFWTSKARRSLKRRILLSYVAEAGISGLTAVAPSEAQLHKLTSTICRYLRVLEQGKAYQANDCHEDQQVENELREEEGGQSDVSSKSSATTRDVVEFNAGGIEGGNRESLPAACTFRRPFLEECVTSGPHPGAEGMCDPPSRAGPPSVAPPSADMGSSWDLLQVSTGNGLNGVAALDCEEVSFSQMMEQMQEQEEHLDVNDEKPNKYCSNCNLTLATTHDLCSRCHRARAHCGEIAATPTAQDSSGSPCSSAIGLLNECERCGEKVNNCICGQTQGGGGKKTYITISSSDSQSISSGQDESVFSDNISEYQGDPCRQSDVDDFLRQEAAEEKSNGNTLNVNLHYCDERTEHTRKFKTITVGEARTKPGYQPAAQVKENGSSSGCDINSEGGTAALSIGCASAGSVKPHGMKNREGGTDTRQQGADHPRAGTRLTSSRALATLRERGTIGTSCSEVWRREPPQMRAGASNPVHDRFSSAPTSELGSLVAPVVFPVSPPLTPVEHGAMHQPEEAEPGRAQVRPSEPPGHLAPRGLLAMTSTTYSHTTPAETWPIQATSMRPPPAHVLGRFTASVATPKQNEEQFHSFCGCSSSARADCAPSLGGTFASMPMPVPPSLNAPSILEPPSALHEPAITKKQQTLLDQWRRFSIAGEWPKVL